jgi:hypothetical protein
VTDDLRSRETYAAVANAAAWQAGGFARTKRVVAERMVRLLDEGEAVPGAVDEATFLEAMLAQVEAFEAAGENEPEGLTDADVVEEIERGMRSLDTGPGRS